jgi:hypothetical protein
MDLSLFTIVAQRLGQNMAQISSQYLTFVSSTSWDPSLQSLWAAHERQLLFLQWPCGMCVSDKRLLHPRVMLGWVELSQEDGIPAWWSQGSHRGQGVLSM